MPNCGQIHFLYPLAFRSNCVFLEWKQNSQSKNFAKELSVEVSDWPSGAWFSFWIIALPLSVPREDLHSPLAGRATWVIFQMMAPPPHHPDTDATLEPWHFPGAECSVVIYYSFPVREATTELQKKTCSSLWSENRGICGSNFCFELFLLGKFTCLALCSVFSQREREAINSICCEDKWDNAGKGTWHNAYWLLT